MMNDNVIIDVLAGDGGVGEGRFFDGKVWTDVQTKIIDKTEDPPKEKKSFSLFKKSSSSSSTIDKTPVPFVLGDGTILVTIPSFRGTCII
ncbi:MAG: hypothetical protein ACI8RD_005209 [Bacillariaceae sp.]|jgi:hypothetical protein